MHTLARSEKELGGGLQRIGSGGQTMRVFICRVYESNNLLLLIACTW